MVDKAKLRERLMATFLDELDEHVRSINKELLSLEETPGTGGDDERMINLFRAAHSLKGASRAVDLPAIEQVCHYAEEVFGGLRDGRLQPDSDLFALLFTTADTIAAAGQELRQTGACAATALGALLARLQAACTEQAGGPPADPRDGSDSVVKSDSEIQAVEPVKEPPGESPARSPATTSLAADSPPEPAVTGSADSSGQLPQHKHAAATRTATRRGSVRVAQDKLDSLLAQSGELLVARQRIEGRPRDLDHVLELLAGLKTEWRDLQRTLQPLLSGDSDVSEHQHSAHRERAVRLLQRAAADFAETEKQLESFRGQLVADARQLKLASSEMQRDIHRVRMFPFAEACAGLDRALRDMCRATGKQVELEIQGGDIEVDRTVLDGLGDPLLHLLRNAIDHGIETPPERTAAKKTSTARVTVSASLQGSEVRVVVADDGRGLNLQKIRNRLAERGLPVPDNQRDLQKSIFQPGFSTAEIVTDVSGRGVGMDVVKSRIEELHGHIDIVSEAGRGTCFTLSLPLTLTTVAALFIRVAGQIFAVPSSHVRRLVRFHPHDLRSAQGRSVLPLGETPVPVVGLATVLELPTAAPAAEFYVGVVIFFGARELLFVVDEVLAEHEAVVKNLGQRIRRVRCVSGAIMLRSGDLALLLNVAGLFAQAEDSAPQMELPAAPAGPAEQPTVRRVLVVEDSITTRALMKSILETAGYYVLAEPDGQEALQRLRKDPVDVVVTDVDMPRMNGFELTQAIRATAELQTMPVILVTARESDADKSRGIEVGANAYLRKSTFDQTQILETIEQLL